MSSEQRSFGHRAASMARVSRNTPIPYRPYSRPTPVYLNPPQGGSGSSVMPLITTRLARICDASRFDFFGQAGCELTSKEDSNRCTLHGRRDCCCFRGLKAWSKPSKTMTGRRPRSNKHYFRKGNSGWRGTFVFDWVLDGCSGLKSESGRRWSTPASRRSWC
jgi:hypothetical protein